MAIRDGSMSFEEVPQKSAPDGYDQETIYKVMVDGVERHLMVVSTCDMGALLPPHTTVWVKPVSVNRMVWVPKKPS